jgi:pyridoxal phosphate enzyme (YggS family)
MTDDINPAENFRAISARIAATRAAAIDPAPQTHLVAITKTHQAADILPVLDAGHRMFGENRVQEAMGKWPELKARFSGIALHLVGPLQTNKVAEAVDLFDVLHSLDRERLADALVKERDRSERCPQLFVQVNTGEEPQKAGIAPKETSAFVRHCRDELKLPVIGLMCIPPLEENPAPHFALLKNFARDLGLEALSMGMSEDFETAIRFGATHVRVGSAIFGARV